MLIFCLKGEEKIIKKDFSRKSPAWPRREVPEPLSALAIQRNAVSLEFHENRETTSGWGNDTRKWGNVTWHGREPSRRIFAEGNAILYWVREVHSPKGTWHCSRRMSSPAGKHRSFRRNITTTTLNGGKTWANTWCHESLIETVKLHFSTQYLTGKCLIIEVVKLETMDLLCICIIYMEVDPDRPLHL